MIKRKDGRYQEKLFINGNYKYFYGKTKAEVLRKINEYNEAQQESVLFNNIADGWWTHHEPTLAPNTTKGYKPAKERAKEYFKGRDISTIVPQEIFSHLKKFAITHANKTVNTQLLVYNLIFTYAVQEGYIMFNPSRDIKAPAGTGKNKRGCPSKNDIQIIKNSVNCTFGLFPYMAMYTGLRKGELLALTKSDIDLKNRRIRISKSVYHINNKPYIKEPKTETSNGYVPILDKLLPYLQKLPKGLLFSLDHENLLTESQYNKLWETYQKETGTDFTAHQLRHCYSTMLFENGIKPEEAQVLLRHAQLSTTMDIYKELREDKRNEIFQNSYAVDI